MATEKQELGAYGEIAVVREVECPRCKRARTLKRLPTNFRCADVICDFCGYLAQVKTVTVRTIERIPERVLGAAWLPQKERMDSGIYFPLFLVLVDAKRSFAIYYLPADLQDRAIFAPRTPLSGLARRAGWRGFVYSLEGRAERFTRLK